MTRSPLSGWIDVRCSCDENTEGEQQHDSRDFVLGWDELAVCYTLDRYRCGDGTTPWGDLPWVTEAEALEWHVRTLA